MASGDWLLPNKAFDCCVKHVGSLSYTEDDILIYTLYVSSSFKKSDESKLKQYFEKFGEVENVDIITRKKRSSNCNRRTFSFAFVCFKEAESASKALKCVTHFFLNKTLQVRSADSWKQPVSKQTNINENDPPENELNLSYSILNLNDDCLFLIFKHLPFNDQIKLSTLCTRLENVFILLYKTTKSLEIDLSESLTLLNFRQGLQKMGHHIENIIFYPGFSMKNFTRFINFVSSFCPNLCKLQLDSLHFKYNDIFQKISMKLQTIRHLELKNCSINDEMTKLLSHIPTIEYLDLTDNYEVTGSYLQNFPNLKSLILNNCANIQSTFFVKMCSKTKKIKELNIRRCDRLNTAAINALVENLDDLETLTICSCYQTIELENITKLKSLKHLTIHISVINSSRETDKLFSKLAEEKAEHLKTLKVMNYVHTELKTDAIIELKRLEQLDLPFANITEKFILDIGRLKELKILSIPGVDIKKESLLECLKRSINLQFVDLSRQEVYDDEFVKNVIDILKKQNRNQPLTLRVGFTNVSVDINEKKFIKENSTIIKIDTHITDYVMEMFDSIFDMSDEENDFSSSSFESDFNDDFYGVDYNDVMDALENDEPIFFF